VAIFALQLDVKRPELLHEAVPNAKSIGILFDTDRKPASDALDRAADYLGIYGKVQRINHPMRLTP